MIRITLILIRNYFKTLFKLTKSLVKAHLRNRKQKKLYKKLELLRTDTYKMISDMQKFPK